MSPFVLDLLVKVTFILMVGLAVAATLRASVPSIRHLVLFATIGCCLAMPVVMGLAPRWDVPLLPAPKAVASVTQPTTSASSPTALSPQPTTSRPSTSTDFARASSGAPTYPAGEARLTGSLFDAKSRVATLTLIWMLGFSVVIAWLVVGRLRLRRIRKMAWALASEDWSRILDDECRDAEVGKPVQLFSSSVVSTPLTWGWRAPVILLPEDAIDWPEDHRRIVLRHELAHVARNDALSQLVAGFACALYWFHPVVWLTERRLRAECERACDDKVVSQGTPPAEYAAHLLEVARSARAFGAAGFLSVAMARPSQLEGRLLAVLNHSRQRVSISRAARPVAIALSALVLLPLAAFRPVAKPVVVMRENVAPAVNVSTSAAKSSAPTSVAISAGSQTQSSAASKPVNPGSANSTTLEYSLDSTISMNVLARSGGTLDLDLRTGGAVVISGSDRSDIAVRGSLRGRDWRSTRVRLVTTDEGARLESYFVGSSNNTSTSHHFDISVPRNFSVHLRSSGGSVSIENVTGNFSGSTGGGEINIRGAGGRVDLSTGGGDIYVADSKVAGNVSTGGGVVKLIGVEGKLKGSSGSGPVIYTNSSVSDYSGGVTMSSAGGAISLPSAPDGAHVTTGGGRIHIGPSGGEVYAHTGGGDIDIGPATGSVEATTGAGDVAIELKGADSHAVGVHSGTGSVELVVPQNLNATLDLETAYTDRLGHKTRIISDWPLSVTETSEWDDRNGTPRRYVRVRQTIGRGGPVIRVQTVNGDITLRRGS